VTGGGRSGGVEMIFLFDNFERHEQRCTRGHSASATIASIEAALCADPNIDSSAITPRMLGPVVILEGFVAEKADRQKAVAIAAEIVGPDKVRDRMLYRDAVR
jgi:osmotically-inducible protein OsmY